MQRAMDDGYNSQSNGSPTDWRVEQGEGMVLR